MGGRALKGSTRLCGRARGLLAETLPRVRLCSLMSVDDVVHDCLALLAARGVLDDTYIIYSSDHGYHLGQWGLWSEKVGEGGRRGHGTAAPGVASRGASRRVQANPLETDVRVPLAIRGPGIAPGSATLPSVLVSNIDLAPTMLDWAGAPNAWPSGVGVRDGRSLVPVLAGAAAAAAAEEAQAPPKAVPPPPGWRDRLLLEFVGWPVRGPPRGPCAYAPGTPISFSRPQSYEWLSPCSYGFIDPSACAGPSPPAGLINAASNNWVALRVVNATDDFVYAEVRPGSGCWHG